MPVKMKLADRGAVQGAPAGIHPMQQFLCKGVGFHDCNLSLCAVAASPFCWRLVGGRYGRERKRHNDGRQSRVPHSGSSSVWRNPTPPQQRATWGVTRIGIQFSLAPSGLGKATQRRRPTRPFTPNFRGALICAKGGHWVHFCGPARGQKTCDADHQCNHCGDA